MIVDIRGRELKVGDRVLYSRKQYHKACLVETHITKIENNRVYMGLKFSTIDPSRTLYKQK